MKKYKQILKEGRFDTEYVKTYDVYIDNEYTELAFHLINTGQIDKDIFWYYAPLGQYWYYNTIQFILDTPPSDPYFDANGLYSVNEYQGLVNILLLDQLYNLLAS